MRRPEAEDGAGFGPDDEDVRESCVYQLGGRNFGLESIL
jgi:hypothetical protein